MRDEKYNGWTNYETWSVALLIDNEEGSYRYWRAMAQDAWDNADDDRPKHFTRDEHAAYALAGQLKEWHEQTNPLAEDCTIWSQLLGAALCEVNWDEIARHWIADVDKSALVCSCSYPGCQCENTCTDDAEMILYRVDMEDETGTPMCEACADDAMESGLFRIGGDE